MKTLQTTISLLESFAPPSLAMFDYVGLLHGRLTQPVKKVGLTLDYSLQAINIAVANGCDLLITHHGPLELEDSPMGNSYLKRQRCVDSNLAVYRYHLNLDFCNGGIIEELCSLLKIPAKPITLTYQGQLIHGGVRVVDDHPMTFDALLARAEALGHGSVRVAGKKRQNFRKIAITSGKGFIGEFFDQIKPEVYIAGEFEQEATKYAEDLGIMLVELSHHASESRPLEHIAPKLQNLLEIPVIHIEVPDTIEFIPFSKEASRGHS